MDLRHVDGGHVGGEGAGAFGVEMSREMREAAVRVVVA